MSTGASLFTELRAPQLKMAKSKDLIRLLTAYEAYESQVADLNENRGEEEQLFPVPLTYCLDPVLKKGLVHMQVFDPFVAENADGTPGKITNAKELSHDIIKLWLEYQARAAGSGMPTRVEEALAPITMKYDRNDRAGCAQMFSIDVFNKLVDAGCESALETAGKEIAKTLMPKLVLSVVRDVVTREFKFWTTAE